MSSASTPSFSHTSVTAQKHSKRRSTNTPRELKTPTNANCSLQTKFSKVNPAEGLASCAEDMGRTSPSYHQRLRQQFRRMSPGEATILLCLPMLAMRRHPKGPGRKRREFSTSLGNGEKKHGFGVWTVVSEIVPDAVQILWDERADF